MRFLVSEPQLVGSYSEGFLSDMRKTQNGRLILHRMLYYHVQDSKPSLSLIYDIFLVWERVFICFNFPLENGEHLIQVCSFSFQDEDVYTFFEPDLPSEPIGLPRTKIPDGLKPNERRSSLKAPAIKSGSKSSQSKAQRLLLNSEKKNANHNTTNPRWPSPEKISWNVLDLKKENYYSCSVGRARTNARYLLQSSDDVVSFLKELAGASSD